MIYTFDDGELDTQLYTLRRAGQTIRLRPKVFQVLLYLLEHRDRVVSKQDLCDAVWPEQFISDATLESTIRSVRRALGESARAPRVIRTHHGHGYRFVAPVTESTEARAGPEAQTVPTATGAPEASPRDVAEAEEAWQCPACHHLTRADYPRGVRFCSACGTPCPLHCPKCGEEYPPHATFCAACGALLTTPSLPTLQPGQPTQRDIPALHAEPRAAERRHLTVLFCDLVDSTTLARQLELEDYHSVVRAYHETCAAVIARFEGHVAQYLGDGVLGYFSYPRAHEDDAQRAIHAALGIVEGLEALRTRLRQEQGIRLAVRLGIHTGLVIVEARGDDGRHETVALGEPPNVAARLQNLAAPDTVVISAVTARLVQGYFVCQDLGLHILKGLAAPLRVFRVLEPSGVRSRLETAGAGGLTPLVGREAEVALLLERWAQVQEGVGHVILLNGETGIGKTRLVQTLKAHLAGESHTWLECRCSPYYQHSAFYPVLELCQRILRWRLDDTPEAKRHKLEATLAQFSLPLAETLALLTAFLSLPQEADRSPLLQLTPQQRRHKTLAALLALVLELAARRPVLLLVEDLHWSDPSTLELLDLLVDQTPSTRIQAVLTCRPTFQASWGNRSYLTQITLTRLSRQQVEQMVLGLTRECPLPGEVLQQIIEKADGVPLYVEEMTKAVLESGLLRATAERYELTAPLPAQPIPATLHDSLMARLDRLDTAKGVAQLGAVLGRQFPYALLRAVAEQDDASLQRELRRLAEAELIYQQGVPPQATYVFKHALIQQTAYQSLVRSTREHYHQRIAQLLAEQFPDTVETQPELLAYHYTEAGLVDHAISSWQRAGECAVQRSANIEAINHLTKGLELLATLPDTPERAQHELTLQLTLATAFSVVKGYGAPEVERAYIRARELCRQVEDNPQLFAALAGLRRFYNNRAEYKTSQELAEQHLQLAQRLHDPTAMLQAYNALGITSFHLGEFPSALAHLEQGIALYDPQQHRVQAFDPFVSCLSYAAWALWFLGYPDQALRTIHEALILAQQLAHAYNLGIALHFAASLHIWRRELQLAQERAEATIALAREHGFTRWLGGGMVRKGWALAAQGATKEGIAQIQEGLTTWQDMGTKLGLPHRLAMLAEAYSKVGQANQGLHVLAQAQAAMHDTAERYCEAELYRLRGELLLQVSTRQKTQNKRQTFKEAEECFLQALDVARHQQARSLELRAAMSLGRLWQRQGKHAEAHQMLAEIYNWFTEGFDTLDLQEAKALLETLI